MIDIFPLTSEHPLWGETVRYAQACPWRAGPYLAREMNAGRFSAWERVFCLLVDGDIAGFCTFTEQDELDGSYGFSPFIGFVYVEEKHRGNRYSQRMIDTVMRYAGGLGFEKVYLMSGEKGLYEKYGFEMIGEYPTIFGTVDQLFAKGT